VCVVPGTRTGQALGVYALGLFTTAAHGNPTQDVLCCCLLRCLACAHKQPPQVMRAQSPTSRRRPPSLPLRWPSSETGRPRRATCPRPPRCSFARPATPCWRRSTDDASKQHCSQQEVWGRRWGLACAWLQGWIVRCRSGQGGACCTRDQQRHATGWAVRMRG
jgi:hypothetical protein